MDVNDVRMGRRCICLTTSLKEFSFTCTILIVYAPNCSNERRLLWEELIAVKEAVDEPMLAMGDFNEIFTLKERRGGVGCLRSMEEFKNWAMEMGLSNIQLLGRKYRWARGNSSSRIDRMLVEANWWVKFPELKLLAISSKLSDHTRLVLDLNKINDPKPFRSLDAWFSHPNFKKMVQQEW